MLVVVRIWHSVKLYGVITLDSSITKEKYLMLKYEEIEMLGFKRMKLNTGNYFRIRPSEPIQLVVGTNGSGKSSLLNEITFLPADKDAFDKDGFKRVVGTFNGHVYETLNNFASSPAKYSFKRDDEELNPGGTISVQKDLVQQHFGITTEIQNLLINQIKFTNMTSSVRREWFTKLSEVDYNYAIDLYNRMREKHRDVTGAIKLAKKRILLESSKIISDAEKDALEKEVDKLHLFIQHLNEHRGSIDKDYRTLEDLADSFLAKIEQDSKLLIKKKIKLKHLDFSNVEAIENRIVELKNLLEVNKQINSSVCEDFNQINETLESLKLTGKQGTEEILRTIQEIKSKQTNLRSFRNICQEPIPNPTETLNAFESVKPAIDNIFQELPQNSDRRYTPQTKEANDFKLFKLLDEKNKAESIIKELMGLKSHQEAHRASDKIECPQCNYKWNLGFDALIYKDIVDKLEKSNKSLEALEADIKIAQDFNTAVNEYLGLYRNFFSYVNSWPILRPLWNHLVEKKFILENPTRATQECNLFLIDLKSEQECAQLQIQIDQLNDQLKIRETIGNQDVEKLAVKQKELEHQIHNRTKLIHNTQQEINKLVNTLAEIKTILKLNEEIESTRIKAKEASDEALDLIRRNILHKAIRELQSILARREDILNSVRLQKGIIEDLENQIQVLIKDEESLKVLVKEISPTDGLIAEGLLGFIRHFVAEMNLFIKKVWAYPLSIVPCRFEEDGRVELDYKFPLLVKEASNTVKDVALGSTGMQEVINLAFRLTAMKYLGLDDSPVILDEFGGTLDSVHKESTVNMIKSLVEDFNYSQVYLVSHDFYQYGALENSQLCILNKDNIIIPSGMDYNKHVTVA